MAQYSKPAQIPRGICISNKLRTHYVFPCAGFIPFPDTNGYAEGADNDTMLNGDPSIDLTSDSNDWLIECSNFGTTYFIIPQFITPRIPAGITLTIPDQVHWPRELWRQLGAPDSVHVTGKLINDLGISSFLRQGLKIWSDSTPNFEQEYLSMPFGSTIALSAVTKSPADMKFEFKPNKKQTEPGIMLSSAQLQSLWGFSEAEMPPTISYDSLRHERQITEDVALVSIHGYDQVAIFKSTRVSPTNIYHEIKVLLSIPPHPAIIGRPQHLVSVRRQEPTSGICGFLSPYHSGGPLDEVLTSRKQSGTLTFHQQLNWARDLTEALIHVQNSPAKFYSDLRLDQIVLSSTTSRSELGVLLDFEQSRNVYNWAPPEIYYLEWIGEMGNWDMARTDDLPQDTMDKYGGYLARFLKSRNMPNPPPRRGTLYDNPAFGWYWPWLASNTSEQEAGMVYMLGKALWCIFEGIGDADIILGRSGPSDGGQRFPEFDLTPPLLRDLIKNCTAGAREWIDGPIKIYRRGGKIFPLHQAGLSGDPEASFEETKEAIKSFWQNEMVKATAFVDARIKYDEGEATEQDLALLHYLRRPSLKEVKETLDNFLSSSL